MILFDLDGTLLDTVDDLNDSINEVFGRHGLRPITKDDTRRFVGNGIPKYVERAAGGNVNAAALAVLTAEMKSWYTAHCEIKTRPYDGMTELLTRLRSDGIKTAVVTNKEQKAAEKIVGKYFGDLISLVVGDGGNYPLKPAPDAVYYACRAIGEPVGTSVFVGDSEVDVKTGLNAGMRTIAVLWGFRDKETLTDAGAKEFAREAAELYEMIRTKKE